MNKSSQIVTEFLSRFKEQLGQDVLLLSFSTPKLLDIPTDNLIELKNEDELKIINEKQFDLIIGDLPFGMKPVTLDTVSKLKANKNWEYILTSLRTLKEKGQAFFLIEPSVLLSNQGKKFLDDLSIENFFYNSIFELPEKLLHPTTAFQPIIIHFEKQKQDKLFIAEITDDNGAIFNNLNSRTSTNNLGTGLLVKRESFTSFDQFKFQTEIDNLQTQYKEYLKYRFKDIAIEINLPRATFENKPNNIYIPVIGNSLALTDITHVKNKHHSFLQIALNPEIVKADYLALFFRSELGVRILNSLKSGSYFHKISRSDIENCFVPIPSLEEQDLLVFTSQKLSELQEMVELLKTELSLNPKNADVIIEKFENIQGAFRQLSVEDQILGLIRKGENKRIEFKETFSKDIKTGKKESYIEESSLKNIVGFLNADGGTLLIGVADNGEIKGVNDDFFVSPDKYKINFKNAIFSKIGTEFYSLIEYDLYKIEGCYILKVDCQRASKPCFYNMEKFYVRTNPATDELKGQKQFDYIRERFKNV